ncbi:MAG: GH36-type glycosyl hydrolase domain-containing protein [Chthoniobacteraceae bacterium]
MNYGYFDDSRREYVINRPDTPRPWSNYLGSTEYGAIITNHAGGYSFYKSAARGRFTRLYFNAAPLYMPGRLFYLRDGDTGDYWSASWMPVPKPVDQFEYECRHGMAYSAIKSRYREIATEATYFVPLGRNFEVWILKITNTGSRGRKLSVWTYAEFANDWNVQNDLVNLQYTQYIVKSDLHDGILNTSFLRYLPPELEVETADQGRNSFMTLVGAELAGFDARREAFLGPYGSYGDPAMVVAGESSGSLAHGDNACGALRVDVELAPGESREFMVLMGVGSAERWGEAVRSEFSSVDIARVELEKLKAHWHGRLGRFVAKTPDPAFDSMVNVWGAYNALVTYAWSRAASLVYQGERDGLGYRDTVQDLLGVAGLIPDDTRQRLVLMLTGQTANGGAIPVVNPFAHRPGEMAAPAEYRSDDALWLFNTVPEYVGETGDVGFYDQVLPYADHGCGTVLEHLRRALEFNIERSGPNGLPLALLADWNDCIKLGNGESVFVAFQLRYGLAVYRDIAGQLGRSEEAWWAADRLATLDDSITRYAWDGQWWRRGIRDNGWIVGSQEREEGAIFLEPQPWAVIAGAGSREQRIAALDAVHEQLATEYGAMLCAPPFRHDASCEAVVYNAGQKENCGIFQHPQAWIVIAEALMGRGDRAYEYFRAYLPSAYNDRAEIRESEPYVWCQSTHGRYSRLFGKARLPWLSGTASWSYHAASHFILGIRPEEEGLIVDPCIPSAWDGFEVTRIFRDATYRITVRNPHHRNSGIGSLMVDGREIRGNKVPVAAPGSEVTVEAVLC